MQQVTSSGEDGPVRRQFFFAMLFQQLSRTKCPSPPTLGSEGPSALGRSICRISSCSYAVCFWLFLRMPLCRWFLVLAYIPVD